MTTLGGKQMSDENSTTTTPLSDEGDDSSNTLGAIESVGESNTSNSNDEDLNTPPPVSEQIYSNCDNDSNSSGGSQSLPLGQHVSGDTVMDFASTGYVSETFDMPRSCNKVPLPQDGTSTTNHAVQRDNEEIPVFTIHDENHSPILHSHSSSSTGYISSDHSPASSIITTVTPPHGSDSGATPTENRSLASNYEAGTTDASTTTLSPPVHVLTTINPQPQRATSDIALNVITDLDQAFPQMSRFSSGESLDENLPSLPPFCHIHVHTTNRTHSQSNLYCYNAGSASTYENLKPENSLSRPFSHQDLTTPFANAATTASPRHKETLHVHSTHTYSGSVHDIPPHQIRERHTPHSASSSLSVYTSTRWGGEKGTMISLQSDKDTTMELSTHNSPSFSSYVNHEAPSQMLSHHNPVVVGEECRARTVNMYSQDDESEALLESERFDSVWDETQHNSCSDGPHNSFSGDGNGFDYSPLHENIMYSTTHEDSQHTGRSGTSGYRNISFGLTSEVN